MTTSTDMMRTRELVLRFVRGPGVPLLLMTAVYVVVVPSQSLLPVGSYDEQRTLQAWLVAVAGLSTALWPALRARVALIARRNRTVTALALTCLLLGVLSSALGSDPWGGLLEVGLMAGVVVLALVVAVAVADHEGPALLLVVLTATAALLYYAGDLLTLPGVDERSLYHRPREGGFANVRFMNHFHVALLPLAAVLPAARLIPVWVRAVTFLAPALAAFYLLQTEARGGVLALVVACVAVVATRSGPARRWGVTVAAAGAVGLAGTVLARWWTAANSQVPGGALVDTAALADTSYRRAMWGDAVDVALGNPLLGLGPGGFAQVRNEDLLFSVFAHPHNSVLQFAAEWGLLVGVIVAAGLVATGLLLTFRPAARIGPLPVGGGLDRDMVEAAVSASTLAMLLESGVAGVLMTPVSLVLLSLVAGTVLGVRTAARDWSRAVEDSARPMWTIVVGVAALAALLPLAGVFSRDLDAIERDRCHSIRELRGFVAPRFWEQGFRGWPEADCELPPFELSD